MTRVVGLLRKSKSHRIVLKVPVKWGSNKVFYTVQSNLDPVTFTKRKDAEAYRKLIKLSTGEYKGDIIRREVTEEGYELH